MRGALLVIFGGVVAMVFTVERPAPHSRALQQLAFFFNLGAQLQRTGLDDQVFRLLEMLARRIVITFAACNRGTNGVGPTGRHAVLAASKTKQWY